MENLSKLAREKYEELQRKLEAIVTADAQREPKLTQAEKARIATLEARVAELRPVIQRLHAELEKRDARSLYLAQNARAMVIAGDDIDKLVTERVLSKPAIQLLAQTSHDVQLESGMAEMEINQIKENARARELEAENG